MKHNQWFQLLLAPISRTTPTEVYDLSNNEFFIQFQNEKQVGCSFYLNSQIPSSMFLAYKYITRESHNRHAKRVCNGQGKMPH
jgi:hypothetical protein